MIVPMALPTFLERGFLQIADRVMAYWPRTRPTSERLRGCKLISHRGEHDNKRVLENSYAAFDRAAAAGVWGIECDLRWTKDLVPVIAHDADLVRFYQDRRCIDQLTHAELKRHFPTIADLAGVVERYGRRLHLMIELKPAAWLDPIGQNRTLAEILSHLQPIDDYHFMTLTPKIPPPIRFVSQRAVLPIAANWADTLCKMALGTDWDGVCGHYSMLRTSLVHRLKQQGKSVGTGYADSVNCLYRELNRGIDWIFSNRAAAMQAQIDKALQHPID